jgi:ATP-dependent 26S proteasome regulatory subunit
MSEVLDVIRERIQCHFPLMFLSTWEEERWESELASLALDIDRGLVVWTSTDGASPPLDSDSDEVSNGHCTATEFLDQIRAYPRDHVFLLKDFHPFLSDPVIVRQLRDLLPSLAEQDKTILMMSPESTIPVELRRDSVAIELPLPGIDEIRDELRELLIQRQHNGEPHVRIAPAEEERLLKAVMGLTARQARQSLSRALLGRSGLDDDVYALLISEKKHMVQGSEMLEFHELAEGANDIGGLDSLKDWIHRRVDAFSEKARKRGIPAPKGVLLLGVQGCGKSLTARAVARILSFPVVRLDVSTLLSADLGGSEKNMRDVLSLMEMIAPCVLWMDEVEKGFAGVTDGSGGDATMVRLMGQFLTWMQEKRSPVFVVATANSVTALPPEMLRRGRFDELFFVDLPNYHERKSIFEIHMRKRDLDPLDFNINHLSESAEGYSGAEIEQSVVTALVETFNDGRTMTQKDLDDSVADTVPLSVTMEEKIFELREWARSRCRPATPDSRVLQMLEEEHRDKTGEENPELINLIDDDDMPPSETEEPGWETILKEGQVRAALLEYVSGQGEVTFSQLQQDFASHMEVEGEFGLALRSDPNIVVWIGMDAAVAAPLGKLVSDRKVYLQPVRADAYSDVVGKIKLPKLPGLPDSRMSRPCWLPVSLTVVAPEDVDERLTRVARMKLKR